MLTEYHFKIKHVKETDNAKADAFGKKKELQSNNKVLKALLKLKKNEKIWYNHPQLAKHIKHQKVYKNNKLKKLKKMDLNYKDYKGQKTQLKSIYVPKKTNKKICYRIPQRNNTKTQWSNSLSGKITNKVYHQRCMEHSKKSS